MGNLTTALVFVLVINCMLYVTQLTLNELNPDSPVSFLNTTHGNMIAQLDSGGNTLNEDVTGPFPGGQGATEPTGTGQDWDVFSKITEWFKNTWGIKYVYGIVTAPYYILQYILPQALAFVVGAIWYGITIMLIIAFIFGRDA